MGLQITNTWLDFGTDSYSDPDLDPGRVPGNMLLVAGNMLLVLATCCRATCCPGVNAALGVK